MVIIIVLLAIVVFSLAYLFRHIKSHTIQCDTKHIEHDKRISLVDGLLGPRGPQGPPGPQGAPASDKAHSIMVSVPISGTIGAPASNGNVPISDVFPASKCMVEVINTLHVSSSSSSNLQLFVTQFQRDHRSQVLEFKLVVKNDTPYSIRIMPGSILGNLVQGRVVFNSNIPIEPGRQREGYGKVWIHRARVPPRGYTKCFTVHRENAVKGIKASKGQDIVRQKYETLSSLLFPNTEKQVKDSLQRGNTMISSDYLVSELNRESDIDSSVVNYGVFEGGMQKLWDLTKQVTSALLNLESSDELLLEVMRIYQTQKVQSEEVQSGILSRFTSALDVQHNDTLEKFITLSSKIAFMQVEIDGNIPIFVQWNKV